MNYLQPVTVVDALKRPQAETTAELDCPAVLGQMSAHRAFEDENWLSWINTLPASQRIYAYLGAAAEVATPSISKKIKTSDPSTSQIDSSE